MKNTTQNHILNVLFKLKGFLHKNVRILEEKSLKIISQESQVKNLLQEEKIHTLPYSIFVVTRQLQFVKNESWKAANDDFKTNFIVRNLNTKTYSEMNIDFFGNDNKWFFLVPMNLPLLFFSFLIPGWSLKYYNLTDYFGGDPKNSSTYHFPGLHADAAKWLVEKREVFSYVSNNHIFLKQPGCRRLF